MPLLPFQNSDMKHFVLLVAVIGSMLLTSCATIFCGSRTNVTFDSDIEERATLTIDGQKHTRVTFPYTVKIRRGFNDTVVKAEAPSYKTESIVIYKQFNLVSLLNLLGGLLGWGVDAATGAITKPEHKYYQIEFEPKNANYN